MKFIVKRASGIAYDSPCDGAREEVQNVIRADGTIGQIPRWYMRFTDLHELMRFIVTHGECILAPGDDDCALPSITIYDDYIE